MRSPRPLHRLAVSLLVVAAGSVVVSGSPSSPAEAVSPLCQPGQDDYTNSIKKFSPHLLGDGGARPGAIDLRFVNGFPDSHFAWTIAEPDVTVTAIFVEGRSVPTSPQVITSPTANRWHPVVFCLGAAARPDITLTKTSPSHPDTDGDGVADTPIAAPGTITYDLTATNTGNVTLTDVVISEAAAGATIQSCTPAQSGSLAPGARLRCTATQNVDATAIADGGVVRNLAVVDSSHQGTRVTDSAAFRVPIADLPRIELVKTSTSHPDADGNGIADDPLTAPGDVDYLLTVTNRGNVTLTDLSVSDPDLGTLTCGSGVPTSLAPGASFSCTGSQTVTQGDLDAGGDIINKATASGRGGGSTVTDTDSYDIPIRQTVDVAATKTSTSHPDADGDGVADLPARSGEDIDYVVTVTNTGNVDLVIDSVVDVVYGAVPSNASLVCGSTTLAPTASTDCTGSYTVTQGDVDAFHPINNTVTVTATGPGGAIDRAIAVYSVPVLDVSELTVRKVSTSHPPADPADHVSENGLDAAGDVTFEIEIENTGSTTISSIDVDDLAGIDGCDEPVPFQLAPGDAVTCGATVAVSQNDFDTLPGLVNIAVAAGTDAGGNDVVAADFFVVPFERRQAVTLTKVARAPFGDADGNSIADTPISSPQIVTYELVAVNTGNVTVDDVVITDATLGALTCTQPVSLAPGESSSCTGTRAVTQTDIDNGFPIPNSAFVTVGGSVVDRAAYVILVDATADLAFTKTSPTHPDADGDGTADDPITAAGTVNYTLTAENTGDVTLFDMTITDALLPSLVCGPVDLLPGEELTCGQAQGATYDVGQTEIDAGVDITNTATATSVDIHGDVVSKQATYEIPVDGVTDAELTKTARAPFGDADGNSVADLPISSPQTVTYDLVARNTGTTTLSDVVITDALLGALICDRTPPVSLAPGQELTCTGTRAVTQTDIDDGFPIPNSAFVAAGGSVLDRAAYVIFVERQPGLGVTKTSTNHPDGGGDGVADTPITGTGPVAYVIEVTNTGNTTLANVVIDDPVLSACTAFQVGTLVPGATATCTDTFDVSQDRIDAGGDLVNTAGAAANAGGRLVTGQARYEIPIEQRPELTVTKSAAAPFGDGDGDGSSDTPAVAGDRIDYVVTVTNTGNVTIDSISPDDTITTLTCATDTLAPTRSTTCTGTYTVQQSDVNALTPIQNVASVGGTAPSGQTVSAGGAYLVPVLAAPELVVRKSIPANPDTDGDFVADIPLTAPATIDYEIDVANGGTVDLTDVVVVDTLLPSVTCPDPAPFALAVGATVTCTGSYAVTQAEFDANPGLVNIALAVGAAPGDVAAAGGSIAAVAFDHRPEVTLVKTSTSHPDGDGDGIADDPLTGPATVDYELVATNTGNVTLTDVTVTDPLLLLSCTTATLLPGDALTCSGSLPVGQGTIDGGGDLVNTATASATYGGETYGDRATYDVPISIVTSLALDKTSTSHPDSDGDGVSDTALVAPTVVTYRLTATNDGTTTLAAVEIADPDVTGLVCTPAAPAALLPGESLVCTGTASVGQPDIDAGAAVVNTATATATSVTEGEITAIDDHVLPIERRPDLELSKLPAVQTFRAGDTVTLRWTIELVNIGNVTLTDLTLADVLLVGGTGEIVELPACGRVVSSLAPGARQAVPCEVTRTMTENEVANIAVVEGGSLAGPVTGGAIALVEVESIPPTTTTPTTTPTTPPTTTPTGGGLPTTGSSSGDGVTVALTLVAIGAVLAIVGRRRPI